jgi:hypothetical protein
MLLFKSEVEEVQLTAEYYPLPPEYGQAIAVEKRDETLTWGRGLGAHAHRPWSVRLFGPVRHVMGTAVTVSRSFRAS